MSRSIRRAGLALLLGAGLTGLAAWPGPGGLTARAATLVELAAPDDVALVEAIDAEISDLAGAVGACEQDGGDHATCLCAARPALSSLAERADATLQRRPDWAGGDVVVGWRHGTAARLMSLPGVHAETQEALRLCRG
jgi:hypothetical protein